VQHGLVPRRRRLQDQLAVDAGGPWFGFMFTCMAPGTMRAKVHEATSEGQTFRKRPSLIFMMLALCTAVTVFRLFSSAYSNAYCAVRLDLASVIICQRQCGR